MNILAIYAHPNDKSLNSSILKNVKEIANQKNHSLEILNLYEENFDPVLIFNENQRRRDLHKDKSTEKYRKMLEKSDLIIFIYPIWWNEMPAILKGFIDRVFVKDFAYKFKGMMPIGLLKQKKSYIINTMDAPKIFVKLILLESHYKNFKNNILKFCGVKNLGKFTFYNVKNMSKEKLADNLEQMKRKLERVL